VKTGNRIYKRRLLSGLFCFLPKKCILFLGKSFSSYVTIYKSVNLDMKIKNLIFLAGMAGLCACGKGTHTQKAYVFVKIILVIHT
jgi:hypothetical protein